MLCSVPLRGPPLSSNAKAAKTLAAAAALHGLQCLFRCALVHLAIHMHYECTQLILPISLSLAFAVGSSNPVWGIVECLKGRFSSANM